MYYEEQSGPRRRFGILKFLLKLIFRVLVLLFICAVLIYIIPVAAFMIRKDSSLSPASGLGMSRINILIIGVDRENYNSKRADSIIVMSVGYTDCHLTSILRDTMVNIPGKGIHKICEAYAYGGAELTVRTVNENFGLNITKYVVLDFVTVSELISAVGGIDVSITSAEQDQINYIVGLSWPSFREAGYSQDATSKLNLDFSRADADGRVNVHLDGIQAMAYSRIRKIDSDFMRASRQRAVISAVLESFKKCWWKPEMYAEIISVLDKIITNMNIIEILSIGAKVIVAGTPDSMRLPVEGSYTDDGSSLNNVDFDKNHKAFVEFAY